MTLLNEEVKTIKPTIISSDDTIPLANSRCKSEQVLKSWQTPPTVSTSF